MLLSFVALLLSGRFTGDLSGTWLLEFDRDERGAIESSTCEITQEGRSLSGYCGTDRVPLMGAVGEKGVTFEVSRGEVTATFRAAVTHDHTTIRGTWQQPDRHGRFSARRR